MPRHSDKKSLLGSAWQSSSERNVVVLMNGVRRTGGTNIGIRRCFLKQVTVKRCVAGLLVLSLLSILYYTHYLSSPFASFITRDSRPQSYIRCSVLDGATRLPQVSNNHRSAARLRIDPKVLVFVETTYSRLGREIAELLVYNRMKYCEVANSI